MYARLLLLAGLLAIVACVRGTVNWGSVSPSDPISAANAFDSTFGQGGYVITQLGTANTAARALAIQADGAIVVAGEVDGVNNSDLAVVRLLPDGRLDPSFNDDGFLASDVSILENATSNPEHIKAVAIDATNGKIYSAGGGSVSSGPDDFLISRILPTGALEIFVGRYAL